MIGPARQLEEILGDCKHPVRQEQLIASAAQLKAQPLVLVGAGRLGRMALAGLRRVGVEPLAFADNNPALWSTIVDGLPVRSVQEAAERFGEQAVFVVTIYTGAPVRQQLRGLGLRVLPFANLFLAYGDFFLPHACLERPEKVLREAADVRAGLSVWADDCSREEYVAQVRYRLMLDEGVPSHLPPDKVYFPDELVRRDSNELFVDCGAFDGDSIRMFLTRQGSSFRRILGLEPDPMNYARLRQFVAGLPAQVRDRVALVQCAVADCRKTLQFEAAGTAAACFASGGATTVECIPLDDLLQGEAPTFIKMDIEGAEPEALLGGTDVIRRHLPVLAVCLYHRQDHLWRIPLLIRSLSADYRLFLRRYSDDCWEQVCYAVPAHRLAAASG